MTLVDEDVSPGLETWREYLNEDLELLAHAKHVAADSGFPRRMRQIARAAVRDLTARVCFDISNLGGIAGHW